MKKLSTLLFLVASCAAFAQRTKPTLNPTQKAFVREQDSLNKEHPTCGCTGLPPWTLIRATTAQRRFDTFAVKRSRTGQTLDDGILYSIKGILALLDTVTLKKPKKYDGFRAYFATFPEKGCTDSGYKYIPKDLYGKFTLVFVPTTPTPKHWGHHLDDTRRYMIVDGDSVKTIPKAIVALWISKAQKGILAKFDSDGKSRRKWPVYHETQLLWYSRFVLVPKKWTRNGLIDILRCHECSGDTKYIYAGYGAFLSGLRRHYQLTLVFKLSNGTTTNYLSLYDLDDPASAGSDTGDPCPPPSNCSTGIGAVSK
jgi:hypothetical protein